MTKLELLMQGWDAIYEKEDWYPPLKDALDGVTSEQAVWRPAGEHVNTIWESVNHLTYYKERLLKRLTGEESEYPPGLTNDDTFRVPSTSEEDWRKALAKLRAVHIGIREIISNMKETRLEEKIPRTPIGSWIHSLILHGAYHTGQIVFLRKLQGSWPSRRSFE
ncbi:DinB family protein [Cohnella lupini]|uniref:DinB family protein n=1 Tax=Cohnella lupini TaxID=1294267 RepID=A0A3D9IWJ7_9BACL|nr:DinB family protein [Cohnella lupini]RED66200.1 DinB family protein [Cohnella lupini]